MRRGSRFVVAALLILAFVTGTIDSSQAAGTTGQLSGTVTDAASKLPVANVVVNAVSPTGAYKSTTNSGGFFSFTGVTPDTYTVSFQLNGYEPVTLTGITVNADQTADGSVRLAKALTTIGRVTARSEGNAFQPKQTQDTYTVTQSQIQDLLGKNDATSETSLLTRLPGASLDKYGYPVLRGGRESEEGFQFDGIPEVDAFSSQFTNALAINGNVGSLQLTPGAGDVSSGGAGTGAINLIAKRGTYPAFGSLDFEALTQPYLHQFAAEYGFATPDGKISNYVSFLGFNGAYANTGTTPAAPTGRFYDPAYNINRDILDNFVYKFGKNNNQSVQLLYDNQQSNFVGFYGGGDTVGFPTADPYFLSEVLEPYTGLTQSQLQDPTLVSKLPFQSSLSDSLAAENRAAEAAFEPNNVMKVQYSNNLSANAFVTAKFFEIDAVTTIDYPNEEQGAGIYALQGGHRDGGTLDFTYQAGAKHLLEAGGEYDFLHPVYDEIDPISGLLATGLFGSNFEVGDFVSPTAANCPTTVFFGGTCGYLYKYLSDPGPIPYVNEITRTNEQEYSAYLRDKFSPNGKTVVDYGVRLEGANYLLPGQAGCNPTLAQIAAGTAPDTCQYNPTSFTAGTVDGTTYEVPSVSLTKQQTNPLEIEPRIAVSYQIDANDSVRASYGRSVEFPPLAFVDTSGGGISAYKKYAGIPSYSAFSPVADGNAMTCGVTGNLACQNYADQLYWEFQNSILGVPITPVAPETFNNYEFSYSHQFPYGIGMKVTPFYRRGYDALALVAQPRLQSNGQAVINPSTGDIELGPTTATNLGESRTTGVEFYVSKEATYGLSGSLSATYINELTNVVPSPLIQEDFFPPIPTQSLALGNQYRVGFVSPFTAALALSYKTHAGFRFNPIVTYSRGYPSGVGDITAAYVNGAPYNIPNTNTGGAAAFGQSLSPQFVDPQNPGSFFKPNIAATRGTPETSSAGGFVTNPRLNTNMSIEFTPPRSHNTLGLLVTNVFDQTYSTVPSYNSRYQPVATGVSGPQTGYSGIPYLFPNEGFVQRTNPVLYGNQPYYINPSAAPRTYRLYYQLAL